MLTLHRRFQGAAIALVVVAMTTGVAFATSSSNAGWHRDETSVSDPSDAPDSEAPESEAPESEAPDESGAPTDTHGALVSTAANMTTPDGFANHGAFVSCVAHMKDVPAASFDWSTVTPESCAAASGQNGPSTPGRGWGHDKSRGHHAQLPD